MFIERRYSFKSGQITEDGFTDLSTFGVKYADLYDHPIVETSLKDHFRPKTAWENWVFLTHECNLDCAYCFEDKKKAPVQWTVGELVDFFKWQAEQRKRKYFQENSKIMFYGGEPLLEQKLMEDILRKTEGLPFDFGLQTNGTLLDNINDYILDKLGWISVSIDGSKEAHDKNRFFKSGEGSYSLMINNLNEVRPKYHGRILARVTVPITAGHDFFSEMKSIIDTKLFTDYHWQLETPISRELTENDIQTFLKSYTSSIKDLVDFWLGEMKKGNMINIIPFEAAVKKILFNELVVYFRADDPSTIIKEAKGPSGCGDDGKCYACDTLIGKEDAIVGDKWAGVNPRRFIENNKFFVYGNFKGCPRRTINSSAQIAYTAETNGCPHVSGDKPDFYCQAANGFLSRIRLNMKDILDSNSTNFFSPISSITEQLP
ncbi:4Fe-4S cluster-binding domain-containing protein [Candidatus Woesearchaeota archaeon]|nr:4Fe-4S cluster-binding domain-containing protein [Candidatus Woesearchaeota archaeon]